MVAREGEEMKTCKKGLHQYLAGERQCPECAKISKAAYFAANYEKEHARSAARYAANPGKLQAFFKALLLADPDCKKKANALYAKNNVEKVKASREKWKAENPEKNRLASTNHYKNNKVEILARAEKYRLAHPEHQVMLWKQTIHRDDPDYYGADEIPF